MSPSVPVASALLAAVLSAPATAQNADFVWYGGPILAGKDLRPEALAVKDGRVVALGTRADIEKTWKGKLTLPIDLNGQALVAGLVAGSPSAEAPPPPPRGRTKAPPAAIVKRTPAPAPSPAPKAPPEPKRPAPPLETLAADVSPPPDGVPYTIAAIRDTLRAWILRSRLPARHRLVLGVGYDDTKLEEKRPPTREELDTVSATLPVIVVSRAGDAGAYNTIALQRAGISWRTKDPPGGVIRRRGRINEPSGVLEGAAHAAAFAKLVPKLDDAERSRLYAESLVLNAPEEPAAPAVLAAAIPVETPAPAAAPAPTAAGQTSAGVPLPVPPGPRDTGSPALAALVADALSGRATIEPGRPADLTVLSADPATDDPAKLEKLRVVEEVRRGRTVWRRDPTRP